MRNKGIRTIVAELREHRRLCCISNMTFAPIPKQYEKPLEQYVQNSFLLWWDSWIEPRLKELENKQKPRKASP